MPFRARGPRRKLTLAQIESASERFQSKSDDQPHETVEQIAESLGVTKPTLYKSLRWFWAEQARKAAEAKP